MITAPKKKGNHVSVVVQVMKRVSRKAMPLLLKVSSRSVSKSVSQAGMELRSLVSKGRNEFEEFSQITSMCRVSIQPVLPSAMRMAFHCGSVVSVMITLVPSCSTNALGALASGVRLMLADGAMMSAVSRCVS